MRRPEQQAAAQGQQRPPCCDTGYGSANVVESWSQSPGAFPNLKRINLSDFNPADWEGLARVTAEASDFEQVRIQHQNERIIRSRLKRRFRVSQLLGLRRPPDLDKPPESHQGISSTAFAHRDPVLDIVPDIPIEALFG